MDYDKILCRLSIASSGILHNYFDFFPCSFWINSFDFWSKSLFFISIGLFLLTFVKSSVMIIDLLWSKQILKTWLNKTDCRNNFIVIFLDQHHINSNFPIFINFFIFVIIVVLFCNNHILLWKSWRITIGP